MLQLLVHLQTLLVSRQPGRTRLGGEAGQTTAEYALVMLGAAAIAALVVTWASKSDIVGKLFDFALSKVIGSIK